MKHNGVCRETLSIALEAVGGKEALARLLRRDVEEVEAWLLGTRSAPMNAYFEACLLLSSPKGPVVRSVIGTAIKRAVTAMSGFWRRLQPPQARLTSPVRRASTSARRS
jgi:hypothetical protein